MAPLEGPAGVGTLVDAVLLGCAIVQSCVYFKNSRSSMWLLSMVVSLTLLLLVLHLGCMAAWLWENELAGTGDASAANPSLILFGISEILSAVLLFLVRCFFTHRFMRMSQNHLAAFVIFVLCIITFTAGLGASSAFFTNASASLQSLLVSSWVFPFSLAAGQICDLAFSIAIWLRLRAQRKAANEQAQAECLSSPKGFCVRMLLLTAETGNTANSFDVLVAIVFMFSKANFAWVGLFVAMPGVFANTLLAAVVASRDLDIEHRRTFDDKLVSQETKNSPITIRISRDVDKRPVTSLV